MQVAILNVKVGAYQKAVGVLELEAAGSANQKHLSEECQKLLKCPKALYR